MRFSNHGFIRSSFTGKNVKAFACTSSMIRPRDIAPQHDMKIGNQGY